MDNQRKRELRGVWIFTGFSIAIVCIGITMMLLDQSASGTFGTRLSARRNDNLSGFETIVLGVLMLIGIGIVYLIDIKRKPKKSK